MPTAGPADARSEPVDPGERLVITGLHERARHRDAPGFGLTLVFEGRRPERSVRLCRLIVSRVAERIRSADVGPCAGNTHLKSRQHVRFAAVARNQMKDMDRTMLADSVDPANALFQPHWIPRQFQVHDEPAGVLEIESFAGGVGREQKIAAATRELIDDCQAFVTVHTAVKRHR